MKRVKRILKLVVLAVSGLLIVSLTGSAQECSSSYSEDTPSNKVFEDFARRFGEELEEENIQRYYFKSNAYTQRTSDINDAIEDSLFSGINEVLKTHVEFYAKIRMHTSSGAQFVKKEEGKFEFHGPFHKRTEGNYAFRAVVGGKYPVGVCLDMYFYSKGKEIYATDLSYDGNEFSSSIGRKIGDDLRISVKYKVDDEKNEVFSIIRYKF